MCILPVLSSLETPGMNMFKGVRSHPKGGDEGVLRNSCFRGILPQENRGVLGKIVPPGKMRCSLRREYIDLPGKRGTQDNTETGRKLFLIYWQK